MLVAVDGLLRLAAPGSRRCPQDLVRQHKRARKALRLDNQHRLATSVASRLIAWQGRVLLGKPSSSQALFPGSVDELRRLCDSGRLDEALDIFFGLDRESSAPAVETYLLLLKACQNRKAAVLARQLCTDLSRLGLESNRILGETAVITLVKCGCLEEALHVFERLAHRTVFCWTALISGYSDAGRGQEAIDLYFYMREEGVEPDKYTFVSILKACSSNLDLELGKRIHAEAFRYHCECDVFVGTSLVNLYGKCGSIVDAGLVFDRLSQRNVVSWNAMLGAYASQGQAEKVVELYKLMLQEGGSPDVRTFVSVIQACGMLAEKEDAAIVDGQVVKEKSLALGKAMHAEAERNLCDKDVFVGSALVTMYGECGSVADAQEVFHSLPLRSMVTWNAMMAAYVQHRKPEKALVLYQQLLEDGMVPDSHTLVAALQACGSLAQCKEEDGEAGEQLTFASRLVTGKAIHAHAWRTGYKSHDFVGNALISMYGNCGSLEDAQAVFDGLPRRDVVTWNAMLAAMISQGKEMKALELYEQMRQEGVSPDDRTFVSALQACGMAADREGDTFEGQLSKTKFLNLGQAIHSEAWSTSRYQGDAFIGNTLVWMYGKCGSIVDAQLVFDGLAQRNTVSWNVVLSAYLEQGQAGKVLQLYGQMREEGIAPDEVTLISILQACSSTGSLAMCHDIHDMVVSTYEHKSNPLLASTLIHAYGRCASMVEAQNMFDALSRQDVVSWNALIAGYARQGDWEVAMQRYEAMLVAGVKPDRTTFLSLLSVCSHAGMVEKGVQYLESMSRDYGMAPEMEHYVAVVDLLGRAGCFTVLEDMILAMPVRPSLSVWLCLLGACRKHTKVGLGRLAFDRAVQLQPKLAAPYILMSNIYAQAGMVEFADEVNQLRLSAGAWKSPGESWLRHDNQVHTFFVGDGQRTKSHPLIQSLIDIGFLLKHDIHSY